MTSVEDRISSWFSLAKHVISETGWEVAATQPGIGTLSHCSRAAHGRGQGHLIRFDFPAVWVEDSAPLAPEQLLLRPETRGSCTDSAEAQGHFKFRLWKTMAPGDALLEQEVLLPILRTCQCLFGDSCLGAACNFFYNTPVLGRQQLRRNFPAQGLETMAWLQEFHGSWQEYMLVSQGGEVKGNDRCYRMVICFSIPKDRFAHWASPLFHALISMGDEALRKIMNNRVTKELRLLDTQLYIILSLRNFNRGAPMLPADDDAVSISISGGEDMGLCRWTEYRSSDETEKFRLAEYLQIFLKRLGFSSKVWNSLDGQSLVPYQCVLRRGEWMELRAAIRDAWSLQKKAYRRLKGGTTAPGLLEDVVPRFVPPSETCDQLPAPDRTTKVVVRNTFLELEEEMMSTGVRRIKSECELMKLVTA